MQDHRPWTGLITDEDLAAYAASGFGGKGGIGSPPALLIIDMQYRTMGTVRQPLAESMKEFPTSCGDRAWAAADRVKPLLELFRQRKWPVIYPHVAPKKSYNIGRLTEKVPTMMAIPPKGYEFFEPLAPQEGEILIPKHHPSAFFGTALASHLVELKVDTLVMVGCTTSGCVRASAVDAFSYNYKVIIPQECVYDRGIVSHRVNLFDMAQKYADVMPADELLNQLTTL